MRSLDEIEREAHTRGDAATLAIIELCMDACGTRRSEAIERAVTMRASVREAATAEARIADLVKTNAELHRKLAAADRLLCAVRFTLKPYRGANPKPAPKWARYLIDTLTRVYNLEPY